MLSLGESATGSMNVKYINPLLYSTVNVLSTMASVEVIPQKPTLKSDVDFDADITGFIDMSGKNIDGWVAISFQKSTILTIMKSMLGDELTEIDDSVHDLVGEMTNMISGGAKATYSELGMDIEIAQPRVFRGDDPSIPCSQKTDSIVLPFITTSGNLAVEFSFK